MKRLLILSSLFGALVLAIFFAAPLSTAAPATSEYHLFHTQFPIDYFGWNGTLFLQNVSNSASTAELHFAGNIIDNVFIPARGSIAYSSPTGTVGQGIYGLVVSSEQPVESVVQWYAENPTRRPVYRGVTEGSFLLHSGPYYDWGSELRTGLTVFNISASAATLVVEFRTVSGVLAHTEYATVASGASLTFLGMGLPDDFVGWVSVASDQPIVASQSTSPLYNLQMVVLNNALGQGSTLNYMPRIINSAAASTTLFVANPNPDVATYNMELYHACLNGSVGLNGAIPAFGAMQLHADEIGFPCGDAWAAVVSSDLPLLLWEQTFLTGETSDTLSTYGSEIDTLVGLPRLVQTETIHSIFYVQNTGEITATVEIAYYGQPGNLLHTDSIELPGNRAAEFDLRDTPEIGQNFEGSAIVTADQPVRVWVDEFLTIPAFSSCSAVNQIPQSECEALVALYNNTNGPNWWNNTGWLIDHNPCNWYGVTCVAGHIVELSLPSNSLNGSVPTELGNLTNLQRLNLSWNVLSGSIPVELGNLVELQNLNLGFNFSLSGSIPVELGSLTSLQYLRLNHTQLSGGIPAELGNLINLLGLGLGWNHQLGGSIPSELGNLVNLQWLDLQSAQLSGAIPEQLGDLTNLHLLHLHTNQLSGSIPMHLGNLANLQTLNLSNNLLTGEIPQSFTDLDQLESFHFNNNASLCAPNNPEMLAWLTGLVNWSGSVCTGPFEGCSEIITIPQNECEALVALYSNTEGVNWLNSTGWLATNAPCSWYGVSCFNGHVTYLNLASNGLSGHMPVELGQLINLGQLHLWGNQLSGNIPVELGQLTHLTWLDLFNNQLTGPIPTEIGQLTNLNWLSLGRNQLSGNLPAGLGELANLQGLSLGNNQLSGSIPAQLGQLANLRSLDFSSNQLNGGLPSELGQLINLQYLYLHRNQLSGSIPIQLGQLINLQYLYLHRNQLSGSIPAEFGQLANIQYLRLSRNQLSGNVPSELGQPANLRELLLDNNPLSGSMPQEFAGSASLAFLSFYNTDLCTPDNAAMNTWLAGLMSLQGTGYVCGQPTAAIAGVVTDGNGHPLTAAQVVLYRGTSWSKILLGQQTTGADGSYTFADLGQGINYYLHFVNSSGTWASTYFDNKGTLNAADPITLTLGLTRTINAQLGVPVPPLAVVTLGSGSATTITDPLTGMTHITSPPGGATDITVSYAATCDGGATPDAVTLHYNSQSYPMTASGGSYSATIPAAAVTASGAISITTTCAGEDTNTPIATVTLYDPSGFITDALTGEPVAGAKVTLYRVPDWEPKTSPTDTRPNTCQSHRSKPAGAPWDQPAPTHLGIIVNTEQTLVAPLIPMQYTNDQGYYGWDVPFGCWYVVVQAEGYQPLTSPVVGVPPEVTDLDLMLTPIGVEPEKYYIFLPAVMR